MQKLSTELNVQGWSMTSRTQKMHMDVDVNMVHVIESVYSTM